MSWSIELSPLVPMNLLIAAAIVAAVLGLVLMFRRSRGAVLRILSLAALCFVFAARDRRWGGGHPALHRACGVVILVAVAWAVAGFVVDLDLGWLTALYAGEVASVWAFGLSWLVKGSDLLGRPLLTRRGS